MMDIFTDDQKSSELQLVTFMLGGEEYAVDILSVQEIIRMTEITSIPNAPEFIDGIINLRGVVIPVLDLRMRFSMEKVAATGQSRIIVVRAHGLVVGLVVDKVMEVLRLRSDIIDSAPGIVTGKAGADFIEGVGKLDGRLLILVNLDKVLTLDIREGIHAVAGTENATDALKE